MNGPGPIPEGSPAGELAFVERLRTLLPPAPDGQTWIGDDAAVLGDGDLFATDVLVEGVHFDLGWCSPEDVGWKALAVNLSDLAAMGGGPRAAVVSLVVDDRRPGLADQVMSGLAAAASELGCPIVGGDTSNGPALVVSVAVTGRAHVNGPVLRSGAVPGDTVVVTGELGSAAAGLLAAGRGDTDAPGTARLRRPVPRLEEGAAAAHTGATAMIDLSDGLAIDLRRLCEASGCAALIDEGAIPRAEGVDLDLALFGGDDYELLFTVPPERTGEVSTWDLTAATIIGEMHTGAPQVRIRGADGTRLLEGLFFEHPVPARHDHGPGNGTR